MDADERSAPDLAREIATATAEADDQVALFRLRRKSVFMGRWMKRGSGHSRWLPRLIRVGRVRFSAASDEDFHADGTAGSLDERLLHYPFSNGLQNWFQKHNSYSTAEAKTRLKQRRRQVRWRGLLSDDPATRRKHRRRLAARLPLRPVLVFLFLYLVRMGVLEWRAGLTYCLLQSIYEAMVALKVMELQRARRGNTL